MAFFQRIRVLNRRWNDLPRRAGIVLSALLCAFLAAKFFPIIAPLVIGAALAWLITPFAKLAERAFKAIRLPEKAGAIVAVLLVFAFLFFVIGLIGTRIISEIKSLAAIAPAWVNNAIDFFKEWQVSGRLPFEIKSEGVLDLIDWLVTSSLESVKDLAATAAADAAKWTVGAAMGLPQKVLFTVLTIMSTIYMVSDRTRIFAFFKRWLPDFAMRRLQSLKLSAFRAIGGQFKAVLILVALVAVVLTVGFTVLKLPYAFLLAVIIALMDALPIVGVGLFLIPMSIYGLVFGDLPLGIGCAILYAVVIILRQIVEPRVVSVQLGLYPLVTMAAMYAGLKTIGVVGMLIGPMLAMIIKAFFSTETPVPPQPAPVKATPRASKGKTPPSVGA